MAALDVAAERVSAFPGKFQFADTVFQPDFL
jgi:hypothetical protein